MLLFILTDVATYTQGCYYLYSHGCCYLYTRMLHILIFEDATYTYTQGYYIYLYSRMLHILILKDVTYTYTQG